MSYDQELILDMVSAEDFERIIPFLEGIPSTKWHAEGKESFTLQIAQENIEIIVTLDEYSVERDLDSTETNYSADEWGEVGVEEVYDYQSITYYGYDLSVEVWKNGKLKCRAFTYDEEIFKDRLQKLFRKLQKAA